MKKSPLSQFQESPNKFNRNYRGRRQGSSGSQHFQQVHPLNTSTPTYQHNHGNRGYWQNRQRYGEAKNHQGNYWNSPYARSNQFNQEDTSFQNALNNDARSYREMDVSGMFNVHEVLKNPWEELEKEFSQSKGSDIEKIAEMDSSEKVDLDSTDCAEREEAISNDINTSSSSIGKNKESNNSSVDLKIDAISFASKSRETNTDSDDN